jgi:hypothetical protein
MSSKKWNAIQNHAWEMEHLGSAMEQLPNNGLGRCIAQQTEIHGLIVCFKLSKISLYCCNYFCFVISINKSVVYSIWNFR